MADTLYASMETDLIPIADLVLTEIAFGAVNNSWNCQSLRTLKSYTATSSSAEQTSSDFFGGSLLILTVLLLSS